MLDENTALGRYISTGQLALIREGYYLIDDIKHHVPTNPVTDYSYLVFPFAKAYEGFLKQLFLDLGFIKIWQYESDHFRIGKELSPGLAKELKQRSIYTQLGHKFGNFELADKLWLMWKRGRNMIFHYFPHNLKAVTLVEAENIVEELMSVMQEAVEKSGVGKT
ncbi:MAG: hypothetical protein UV61_C0009G0052 [Candidatus Gottesmanbacteria bacterium GW2011_GWB1_43_11]|uniref:Bacterial toxin RNase RnlA/LsoA DBD domain-containing protein n=1 Tax=Candidatus Gottesmanbacteria bacterium GW2011_GWB1_43_11 TaxID=1618446 RepID=A0A0G1CL34_9BACT|nr:MAG: hypothetical protein UV17_C0031G0024 [Candidatus Gottesmanbacteria bacterium GW2011_GWA1_42_26]KKS80892.1 MAG: hypothetical protein UV55_C0026G0002 [Candidatus Gottesmanbacteria bacterium GW2011_GWC1_43_10]KKS86525.1 MAG: hypothetical protein UV61_C0009G0052 [Candidatus Gottesmanbacteria bacterium GW2011_GWB1_43_11]OGG08743.1 MAG: hypothetical protein A2699_06530 [Candidatus Gottesmanbacteria bacterium RIFCSPHIGHO2_01_FULL_43_15]OGG28273.1 MAG: hypothetical protein A3A59_03610 [Candidat